MLTGNKQLVDRLLALEGGEGTGFDTPRLPCRWMGKYRAYLGILGIFCLYLQMEETTSSPSHLLMVLLRPKRETFVEVLCQLQNTDQMKAPRKPFC